MLITWALIGLAAWAWNAARVKMYRDPFGMAVAVLIIIPSLVAGPLTLIASALIEWNYDEVFADHPEPRK
jgi:hypothetical protein